MNRIFSFRPKILLPLIMLISAAFLFQNCGEGFQSINNSSVHSRLVLPAEYNVLKGQVLNQKDIAVVNAEIELVTPLMAKTATTDSRGVYRIELNEADYQLLPQFFSMYAKKPGFATVSMDYEKKSLDIFSVGENFDPQYSNMSPLDNEIYVAIPVVERVVHLGDGNFGGVINSQFQFPAAEATQFSFEFNIDEDEFFLYDEAEIIVKSRGMQNPNILRLTPEGAAEAPTEFELFNSPESGAVGTEKYNVLVENFAPGKNILTIISNYDPVNQDYDDFELITVEVRFKKNLPYCPVNNQNPNPFEFFNRPSMKLAQFEKTQNQCLANHGPIHRSVACMAADIVENQRISTFDYPEKWALYLKPARPVLNEDHTIFFPDCFVVSGLTSVTGQTPIVLRSTLDRVLDVNLCIRDGQATLPVNTVTGYTNMQQVSFALMRKVLGRSVTTPLQLYYDAIEIMGGDSVAAIALIGAVTTANSNGFSERAFVESLLEGQLLSEAEKLNAINLLASNNLTERQQGYNLIASRINGGVITLTVAELDAFRAAQTFRDQIKLKGVNGATDFNDLELAIFHQLTRANNPFLNRLAPPFTEVSEDYFGQFYHWYTYFSVNYVFYKTLTATKINAAASIFERITGDTNDLNVDGQARRSGAKLSCFVDFMEDNRDVNWSQHFQCSQMTDGGTYLNAQLIPFPDSKVMGTTNKLNILSRYGSGCFRSLTNTLNW